MNDEEKELKILVKRAVLKSWAKLLLDNNTINLNQFNQMGGKIEKLN